MFVYSCSVKNLLFRIRQTLGKHFLTPAGCRSVFPQNTVAMLKEVVVSRREVRWTWGMRQNFGAQFFQLWKCWLCDMRSGGVVENNCALSVNQCQLQVLQFSVYPIDLLIYWLYPSDIMILLGFRKLQWIRWGPPNSDHDFFCVCASLALGSLWSFFLV